MKAKEPWKDLEDALKDHVEHGGNTESMWALVCRQTIALEKLALRTQDRAKAKKGVKG